MAQNVVINGVTYSSVPEVDIPKSGGGTAKFYDASGTDVVAANVLDGVKFVGANGEDTGSMTNNGATGGTISTKAGSYTIPAGYTTGGSVTLGGVTDCVASNILNGKTILGVGGSLVMPTISQNSTTKILSIS